MKKETIARIRSKWSKLSKYSLQSMLESDLPDLVQMIQKTYGYSRVHAERECHDFQLTLRPTLNHGVLERVRLVNGQHRNPYS